jgi:cytochrome P450
VSTTLPAPPKNPLPLWRRIAVTRRLDTGPEILRDAGGPVTLNNLAPTWLAPPMVFVTSPQGARDVLGHPDSFAERGVTPMSWELRALFGDNLLVLPHAEWLPRRRAIQPLFTPKYVPRFAGHMAGVAEEATARWVDDGQIDLDVESRELTLLALGRSVLGIQSGEGIDVVGPALRTGVAWAADRAMRPVNLPRWFPTRAQRRARAASAAIHALIDDMLHACRADPDRDAPLIRALMAAVDPQTGEKMTDADIGDELVLFLIAGHDTTATLLSFALWALGHRPELQEKMAAEVNALGNRRLTHEDVPKLGYTVQVMHEAMRLCPPAPAAGRTVVQDIDVDGYRLVAGTFVVVGIYALHHDPTLWEDPLTFDPDRFSAERSAGRDRWQYLPFGGGPRRCMGDHFALLEATLALATVIGRTEISSLSPDFPTATPLTVIPAAPIPLQVRPRR